MAAAFFQVFKVDLEEVLSQGAYMILYSRYFSLFRSLFIVTFAEFHNWKTWMILFFLGLALANPPLVLFCE